jgi:hypothetical protein
VGTPGTGCQFGENKAWHSVAFKTAQHDIYHLEFLTFQQPAREGFRLLQRVRSGGDTKQLVKKAAFACGFGLLQYAMISKIVA